MELVPAAILSGACAGNSGTADGTVVRDSAGIVIVENDHTRPAWGKEGGWRLREEPLVQIGGENAEGPEQLHRVMHTGLLPSGDLMIVNSGTRQVLVFDSLGRHRRTIGRDGDGPGEFRAPWFAYALDPDSLLVVDLYRQISVFDSAGGFARRFIPGNLAGESQGVPIGPAVNRMLLFEHQERYDPSFTGMRRTQVYLARIGMDGSTARDTLGPFDQQTYRYGSDAPYLFGPWGRFAFAASGLWYGPADRFELRRVGMEGGVERIIRLDLPPRPIPSTDINRFVARLAERYSGTREGAGIEERYANVEAPPVYPAYDNILIDSRGNFWVQSYLPWLFREPLTWYVFDPDGRYFGALTTPAGLVVHQVADGKLIGTWTDEWDVEHVRVYRVEGW